jgi:hypothetical protein
MKAESCRDNMIEITRIQILTGSGADQVLLHTKLPSGIFPFTGFTSLSLEVAAGSGETYVKEHFFGIPVEIVRTRVKGIQFTC